LSGFSKNLFFIRLEFSSCLLYKSSLTVFLTSEGFLGLSRS
jgi:hypothetical protein